MLRSWRGALRLPANADPFEMSSIPHLAIVAVAALISLGVPLGLYALLTRGQRRTTRAIRVAAREHGWKYRQRPAQGDPTAFRIDGSTGNGLSWIMTSQQTAGNDQGWTERLDLRFPSLGGEQDFAIEPREAHTCALGPSAPESVESRVAPFSDVLAGEIGFYRQAREIASGLPAFDAAYRILVLPDRIGRSPVDSTLAERMLNSPADAVRPHSVLSWRSAYGLRLQARLPGPPNWSSVAWLLSLGEEMATRVPPPVMTPPPHTLIDRTVARFMRP